MLGNRKDDIRTMGYLEDLVLASETHCNKILYSDWSEPTEEETALRKIAEDYHIFCTGISPRTGEPMPIDGYELGIVNRHARDMLNMLITDNPQFSREEIWKAIQNYSR